MSTTGQRVVIDTNVFITILSKKGESRWIFDKIISGDFILCITNEILTEYWEILEAKTIPTVVLHVVDFLISHPHVHFYTPFIKWNLIKDADDNKFVDCYLVANAQYLISNDAHFSELRQINFPKVTIATIKEFKKIFS